MEGGWLQAVKAVGTDSNYYNRALWIVQGGSLDVAGPVVEPEPTPVPAVAEKKTAFIHLVNQETKRMLFDGGSVFAGKRGAEGGWLASKDVITSDANYYNLANWSVQKNGDGTITLVNAGTKRFLFDTGDKLTHDRGAEGGWLACKPIVGTDANYYNRAMWEIEKHGESFSLVNKETRRYLFCTGETLKANRGAEGGWLRATKVVGSDANYYNRALWTTEGAPIEDAGPVVEP